MGFVELNRFEAIAAVVLLQHSLAQVLLCRSADLEKILYAFARLLRVLALGPGEKTYLLLDKSICRPTTSIGAPSQKPTVLTTICH